MRSLTILASIVIAGAVAVSASAAGPSAGELSIEGGKGLVVLELRGSTLGRLASGTLRVTDLTPRDRFEPLVTGRRLAQERLGPNTILYRGQGLRFRALGGGYRMVVRGNGISISAVGRGTVTLQGDRRVPGEDAGVYSLDGVDCGDEPLLCTPLPDVLERIVVAPRQDESGPGR